MVVALPRSTVITTASRQTRLIKALYSCGIFRLKRKMNL
jgi:hypothetical protein